MKIADREIGQAFVIAEIGINHNGDLETALRLVAAAKEAGADLLKVQLFKAERFCHPKAVYKNELQVDLFRRYEMSERMVHRVAQACRDEGILFAGTPDSFEAGLFLSQLGACMMKVGSDDLTTLELIERLFSIGLPTILSTGMGEASDIDRAVMACAQDEGWSQRLALLYCVSCYPTPSDLVDLRRITTLRERFDFPPISIGFSDHTQGTLAALGAVALGASIIEKHLTLDKSMPGPDHAFSADPQEFADMVAQIRELEVMLGSDDLKRKPEEVSMRAIARRSIIAESDIPQGTLITRGHLSLQRPGTGIPAYELHKVIGKRASRDIPAQTIMSWEDVSD